MSDKDDHGEHGPVRVTDKREEKRLAAEAARLAKEARPVYDETDADQRRARMQEIAAGKGSFDGQLSDDEKAELLRLQAMESEAGEQEPDDDTLDLKTAFLIVIGHDGSARAMSDVNIPMSIERLANADDMTTGCAIVMRDVQASITSREVVFGLQVSAQAMQQQAAQAAMAQRIQGVPPGARRR